MVNEIKRCSGGRWEVYDPVSDIYHIYGSKAAALKAQQKIVNRK